MINKTKMLAIAINFMFSCLGAASDGSKYYASLLINNDDIVKNITKARESVDPSLIDTTDVTTLEPHISLDLVKKENEEKVRSDIQSLLSIIESNNGQFIAKGAADFNGFISLTLDLLFADDTKAYNEIYNNGLGYLLGIFRADEKPSINFHVSVFKLADLKTKDAVKFDMFQKIKDNLTSFDMGKSKDFLINVTREKENKIHRRSKYFDEKNATLRSKITVLSKRVLNQKSHLGHFQDSAWMQLMQEYDEIEEKVIDIGAKINAEDIGFYQSSKMIDEMINELTGNIQSLNKQFTSLTRMISCYKKTGSQAVHQPTLLAAA